MTQKSNLQVANEALVGLKPNVSALDRKEAPACEATIVQYLNGLGKDIDTAVELLRFFRGKIEERRKEIIET